MADRERGMEEEQRRSASVENSIATAHRRINALLVETASSVRAGDATSAQAAFASLRSVLEAHFDQEDHLYYPTIRSLRPEFKPAIEALVAAHDRFRSQFAAIHRLVKAGPLVDAAGFLEEFGRAFSVHEEAEEQMLRSLDSQLGLPG